MVGFDAGRVLPVRLQRAQEEHGPGAPVHGVHHPLQHPLQRRQALRGDPPRHGDQLRRRLHPARLRPPGRGPRQYQSAPAPGRLHTLHREGPEGHPTALHHQETRPQTRPRLRPRVQSLAQTRRVQPLPPQRLAHDGPLAVYERRLPRRRVHLLLHLAPLLLAAQHRRRGKAVAGTLLPGHGLALRGRDHHHPHQARRGHHQDQPPPLQPRLRRTAHQGERLCRRRALPRRGHQTQLRSPAHAPPVPLRPNLRARRRQCPRLRHVRQGSRLKLSLLPHQVQRPHPPERSLLRLRHQERSRRPATHDPL